MKIFVDWSIKKGYTILQENKIQTVKTLDFSPDTEVYIESGCPKFLQYNLIDKGCRIFVIQSNETAKKREELRLKKTDENDVKVIYQLYQEHPELFVRLLKLTEDEIKLRYFMGRYEVLTKIIVAFKHRAGWAEKEYGKFDFLEKNIKELEKEKKKIIVDISLLIQFDVKHISIKGIKLGLIARLLTQAHPKHFSTLSSYLGYCGYKGYMLKRNQKGKGKRPNFLAKSILWFMAKETLMKKTEPFYPQYLSCKEKYSKLHPNWIKGRVNAKALNIVATFIAKEFWYKLHDIKEVI